MESRNSFVILDLLHHARAWTTHAIRLRVHNPVVAQGVGASCSCSGAVTWSCSGRRGELRRRWIGDQRQRDWGRKPGELWHRPWQSRERRRGDGEERKRGDPANLFWNLSVQHIGGIFHSSGSVPTDSSTKQKKMKDRSARLRCGTQHTLNTAILVFPYKMGVTFTSCWSGRTPRITSVPTAFSVTDSINLLTTGRLTCKRVQPIIL
jgi:hypothetical protein